MKASVRCFYQKVAGFYDPSRFLWDKILVPGAERNLTDFLTQNLNQHQKILDLGCGTAANLEKIFSLGLEFKKYLGIDFSPAMLKIAKAKFKDVPGVEFKQQDIRRLDNLGKFDLIISTWVMSHLDKPAQVINQAQKLLTKRGKFFLIGVASPGERPGFLTKLLAPIGRWLARVSLVKGLTQEEMKKIHHLKKKQFLFGGLVAVLEVGID